MNIDTIVERAVQRFMRDAGMDLSGLEYAYAVEAELSRIVNAEM